MLLKKEKRSRILQVAALFMAITLAISFGACGDKDKDDPSPASGKTPVAGDYDISTNLHQMDNATITAVTVTPKEGKSTGAVTVHYTGTDGTTYAKNTAVPSAAGKYAVTFDVAKAKGWKAKTGLSAGTLIIEHYDASLPTPVVADYTIGNLDQDLEGGTITITAVTIVKKDDTKSAGVITIFYEGKAPTVYTKSTTVPQIPGTFNVTFDVAGTSTHNAGIGLIAGELLIRGTLADPDEPEEVETVLTQAEFDALNWGVTYYPLTLGLTVGNDTTEVGVTWYTLGGVASKAAKVRFYREGNFVDSTGKEGVYELIEKDGSVSAAGSNTTHKAWITDLTPGSEYKYAVSGNGTDFTPFYDFAVPKAAKDGEFKFGVIADPQLTAAAAGTSGDNDPNSRYPTAAAKDGIGAASIGKINTMPANTQFIAGIATISNRSTAAGWLETAAILLNKGVSFIASGGDQVDQSGGRESEYDYFFAPPAMRSLPLAPVSGNHDNHMNFNYHYHLPNQIMSFPVDGGKGTNTAVNTEEGRNYFYLYNNILFVVLDTAPYPANRAAAVPYVNRYDDTLKAATTKFSGKYDWLIVQHHKSTASVADHLADEDIQFYVEAGFEKVMSDYNVDFVLAGHDHVYARSYPLAGRDGGFVSVPDKTKATDRNETTGEEHTYAASPGAPIYLTFTTGSGLKYYAVAPDKTFKYGNSIYASNNTAYPYLGSISGSTGSETSTQKGSADYMTGDYLPVSNAAFVQPYIPSYCIATVSNGGKTIRFETFAIATVSGLSKDCLNRSGQNAGDAEEEFDFSADDPYDWVEVSK